MLRRPPVYVFWVVGFQNHLKAEIEVFITSIFLRILESEHSAFDHKVCTIQELTVYERVPRNSTLFIR